MNQDVQTALRVARKAKAGGGFTFGAPHMGKRKPRLFVGPLHSAVAGRTDHLPTQVPNGSYVLTADCVSSHGEGNTLAGFKVLRRVFGGTPYGGGELPYGQSGGPYGEPLPRKDGGETGAVPVVLAGGEMVLSPEQVRAVGDGDLEMGHRVLDEFVKRSRRELIKTLGKLPGPRRD